MAVWRCFQWFKDTNLKANHNTMTRNNTSKSRCFQWFKDTNLKANHNIVLNFKINKMLFPMVQRY